MSSLIRLLAVFGVATVALLLLVHGIPTGERAANRDKRTLGDPVQVSQASLTAVDLVAEKYGFCKQAIYVIGVSYKLFDDGVVSYAVSLIVYPDICETNFQGVTTCNVTMISAPGRIIPQSASCK